MTIARKQDLKCYGEWQFCSIFYALEIKEDYMKVEESKAGVGLEGS